jgi:hypothetical protein
MHAAQESANDSKTLSGKLLTETNKAANAKMLPTTTKSRADYYDTAKPL